jgi:hypothetical protein
MTDQNPNRPTGSSVPPDRDRVGGTPPPEHRPPRGDGGNSAMALIVGALAVALIIGAFFWFAGDTQDTATLEDPAVVEEDMGTTDEPATGTDAETTLGTDQDVTITEEETNTTMTQEPAEDTEVIDETQQDATGDTGDREVIDETQQN